MVLFWHGHFATSVDKVRDAYFMWRQNELFRRLATGNWLQLLTAAAKTRRCLSGWIRRKAANSIRTRILRGKSWNCSRWAKVITASKTYRRRAALTGWSLERMEQRYIYRSRIHDDGAKTFLGRTGELNGDECHGADRRATAGGEIITAKLWNYFAGQEPDEN